ncbi:hypothetical protein M2119_000504 [Aurantimicrobium minutum]|uniref:hypothetical protein n=1 Tax=Aurantimicrobium minutum TaxID=708131 RepID=UPI002476E572|nr:hypothetical protein [Aurantimicrobium minutum]MDH6532267.1 hypothetical protein [Aurantimicrobium minutum]
MKNEHRLYAKLTLDFGDSPKIAPLSDKAFRDFVLAILWSRRQMTDGFIPDAMKTKIFTKKSLNELLNNDLVNPSIKRCEGGFLIHDFTEHQTTKAQIQAKVEAGRKGGIAKSEASKPLAGANNSLQQNSGTNLAKRETERESPPTGVKATRIPEDFPLTDSLRQWASKNTPGMDLETKHKKFVSHYQSATGDSAIKLDWNRAWQTWMLGDFDKQQATKPQPIPIRSAADTRIEDLYCKEHTGWPQGACERCEEEQAVSA